MPPRRTVYSPTQGATRQADIHRPCQPLNVFERGSGLLTIDSPKTGWWSKFIRRGQLTFSDVTVV